MRADTPADIVAGAQDSIWHLKAAQKTEWMNAYENVVLNRISQMKERSSME